LIKNIGDDKVTDIVESVKPLCRKYSAFAGRVQYDVSASGENFVTMTMPNEKNPKFPLTVMIYEGGRILTGLGNSEEMLRCRTQAELCDIIEKILADEVYFTSCFKSEKDFDRCRTSEGRVDTDENKYKEYIESLEKEPGFFEKIFGGGVGIYETTDFSGRSYRIIKRGLKERT
jgi:hypothetical protein